MPGGILGYEKPQSALNAFVGGLSALVFASQSPYSGGKNVVNSRNVKRHCFAPP
jgi:hypothetical protein